MSKKNTDDQPQQPEEKKTPQQTAEPTQQQVGPETPQQNAPQQPQNIQQSIYNPNMQYGQQPQPVPIYVDPNAAYNAQRRPAKTTKTGAMICGIIFTIFALIMSAVTAYEYFAVFMSLESTNEAAGILTFFAFLFVYGWFTYLPALACAITGVCCSASGTKSSSKGQKATSIIFLVFSIITLVALVLLFFLAFLFVGTPK